MDIYVLFLMQQEYTLRPWFFQQTFISYIIVQLINLAWLKNRYYYVDLFLER